MTIVAQSLRDEFETVFLFGDRHADTHSPSNDRVILKAISLLKPDIIIDGGDPVNADCLGNFKKTHAQKVGLTKEIAEDRTFRNKIDTVAPSARKIMLEDNHFVRRLDDFICDSNWWLAELDQMKPQNILPLAELGWELLPEFTWKECVVVVHGDVPRLRGSIDCPVNKCRQIATKSNITFIKFHSHVTGFEMLKSVHGVRFAGQVGTIMDPEKVSYEKHHVLSMATSSFGILYLSRTSDTHFLNILPIVDGRAIMNGYYIDGHNPEA